MTVAGTPGHRALSRREAGLIDRLKRAEEAALRALDRLEEETVDPRWRALARTQIEMGFMAAVRSVARPPRLALPKEEPTPPERAWLIESGFEDGPRAPLYFSAVDGAPTFQPDHYQALRFARKEDAEAFFLMHRGSLDGVRVCEHEWVS